MSRQKFIYRIWGYRPAPESFRASKGLSRENMTEIPLSSSERHNLGYLYITKGLDAAVDFIKKTERAREKRCRHYMTYGFMSREEPRTYVYSPSVYCRTDADLQERLRMLRELRDYMAGEGGRVEKYSECDLDGRFRPCNVREHYVTADVSRPVVVFLCGI